MVCTPLCSRIDGVCDRLDDGRVKRRVFGNVFGRVRVMFADVLTVRIRFANLKLELFDRTREWFDTQRTHGRYRPVFTDVAGLQTVDRGRDSFALR
jgi:hypothetical protein